jgi:glycosyltransferase involved in cell wall biosynthesis
MTKQSGTPASEWPRISVIVCTRDRPVAAPRAIRSLLCSDYPNFEIFIVDQSDDGATASALQPLLESTARVHLFRLARKGKAVALNHVRQYARGKYLALTDDDCEIASDCLSAYVAAFDADPRLAVVFGDVTAAPFDRTRQHIPQCRIETSKTICSPDDFLLIPARRRAPWLNFGMGANMAISAAALEEINGWDECIGPGAKFGSGDDHNVAFLLLRAGYHLQFSPRPRVIHHGLRRRTEMERDECRIGCGFGASFAKYFRCGTIYRGALRTLRFHLLRYGFYRLQRRASVSGAFIRGWFLGFAAGLVQPLNKETLQFQTPERSAASVTQRPRAGVRRFAKSYF